MQDMYTIIHNYELAEKYAKDCKYDKAKSILIDLLMFYNRDAELHPPGLEIASEYANKAEALLEEILPNCTEPSYKMSDINPVGG